MMKILFLLICFVPIILSLPIDQSFDHYSLTNVDDSPDSTISFYPSLYNVLYKMAEISAKQASTAGCNDVETILKQFHDVKMDIYNDTAFHVALNLLESIRKMCKNIG